MCGIVGFSWEDKDLIKQMTKIISHRGPDDFGFYTDKNVSLGHRRLSIIDLSKKASQPMFNEDSTIVIIFNGEIYNFKTLRSQLEKKGHKFNSNSDTETILHGYEEFGEKICSLLDGMFAFAIWDIKKKRLVLARDRIGKKPLYYYFKKNKLIFSSEIKAILLDNEVKREINFQCLSDYLSLRYSAGNETIFKEIKKLPPGSYLVYSDSEIKIRKYWSLPPLSTKNTPEIKIIDSLIEKAVEKRLMSDAPLGVFLSGGLDSSTIVAYMSRLTDNIKTFSVGFRGVTDETNYAELIARKFNTNHKKIMLDENILPLLPKVVWHFDEPLADPAALPTYLLCEKVSKEVKVALSGEGGDETFGGYHTFNYIKNLLLINKFPKMIRKPISRSLYLGSYLFKYPKKQILKLGSEIFNENDLISSHKKLFYFPFNKEDKKELLSKKIMEKVNLKNPIDKYLNESDNLWNNAINYYFKDWLPNDLLMKGDKMGMAHSLELRMPFLDKDLISYFFSLHNKYKQDRMLFRKVVSKILPKEILKRKKQGFTMPISEWFTKKEFIDSIKSQFEDLSKRGIFSELALRKIISNPGYFKNDHRLWILLNFELWYKLYIEKINYKNIRL